MEKKMLSIFVCTLLFITAVLPIAGTVKIELKNNKISNQIPREEDLDFVPGEIVIKIIEGTTLDLSGSGAIMTTGIPSIDRLNNEFKVWDIEETFLSVIKKPKNPELFHSIGLDRIYTFKVDEGVDFFKALEAYKKDSHVEAADVSGIGHGAIIPSDPNFNKQWGFHNTGQLSGTPDADIDAPEGWDIEMGNLNIIVAIVDSGIDYNHQDLMTRIWINTGEDLNGNYWVDPSDFNGIDDDGNGFIDDLRGWDFVNNDNDPMDDHTNSHGTHCAGIAGANTNNNIGVSGTLWACQLMPVKSMKWNNDIRWEHAGPGIVYAADNGAHVISMSFSGGSDNVTLENACAYAYASGCVLVAAMGNHGSSSQKIPAKYSTTIAVGATDRNDTRWSSSGWGSHIDVVAPGVEIYSTKRNNQYGFMTGTSMATPMVAGFAGLLIAQDSTLTNVGVRNILHLTSEDQVGPPSEDTPGFDQKYGYGRINAYIALYGAPLQPSKPSGPPNGNVGTQYTYTTVAHDPNEDDLNYMWDWGDGTSSSWDGPYNSGQQVSASHTWTTEGTYPIKVKAKDTDGKESDWSEPLSVTMPKNKPFNFNFPLISWLFERFPNAFPILRHILGL